MKKLLLIIIVFLGTSLFVNGKYYYDDYQKFDKVIRINTFANKLSYYEKGEKIGQFDVSAGSIQNNTPRGRFVILNKSELMYSKSAGKYMPYWLDFWKGLYGIHGLPQDYSGNINTTASIGNWAEAGCVRLEEQNIKKLYERADLGTVVLVDYDKQEYSNYENDKQVIINYFDYINNGDYQKAFDLRVNMKYGFDTFKNLYNNINININNIENINGGDFRVGYNIYIGDNYIKTGTSKFQVSDGTIVRSYIIR
ncbi:L,D-transpeptidase [Candidatus Vampirococcus lugosii]|uniref:L,D-transpeptidase catalytic domain containing protein n=1 Tax=Candidatus Vampirococcus lugosii TaxID=2789015 RepID=A0ABS5QMV5_9BACT|nr:L,D-transpeptidase [Candidatus Vampirococcus lugosii]MBS8122412.1 L,D-transpeptidase catalytic domain containing protein [Candidatus Vampirococcus lugosii]